MRCCIGRSRYPRQAHLPSPAPRHTPPHPTPPHPLHTPPHPIPPSRRVSDGFAARDRSAKQSLQRAACECVPCNRQRTACSGQHSCNTRPENNMHATHDVRWSSARSQDDGGARHNSNWCDARRFPCPCSPTVRARVSEFRVLCVDGAGAKHRRWCPLGGCGLWGWERSVVRDYDKLLHTFQQYMKSVPLAARCVDCVTAVCVVHSVT
jgi:hypothetical protein